MSVEYGRSMLPSFYYDHYRRRVYTIWMETNGM
jgi:hypothetical protein